MQIIANRKSRYQILTPHLDSPAEGYAAEVLQHALHEMTGVMLPIRAQRQRVSGHPAILIAAQSAAATDTLWEKDSYTITPRQGDLLLSGNSARAAHYAVTAWLESLGLRWHAPGDIMFPPLSQVGLPEQAMQSTAAFGYRHVFYPTAQQPEWALRWKLNVHNGADARWGDNAAAHGIGHSFAQLVPVAQYYSTHPEYFSLVDGVRRSYHPQLCCSNPAVVDAASETMARWIAENPTRRIFPVGMNDWDGWCECPDCAEIDRREGGPTGQLLTLVNRVAARFPERIIATLAYSWSIDPPRHLQAADNVLIVLCHNEGCFTHALDGCELNRRFITRVQDWRRIARHLMIWDYYVNYYSYLMPTPNFRRIEVDIRLYRDLGIEGMFCQGSACRGGQFEGVRQYLQARLLWNPDEDAGQIMRSWYDGVYGPAAGGRILDYLEMLEAHIADRHIHMPSFAARTQPDLFTPEVLANGAAIWDALEQQTRTPAERRKVLAARAPEMCSRLMHAGISYVETHGKLQPTPTPDTALAKRFVAAVILGGAAHLRENDGAPESFGRLYGRTYPVAILENASLRCVIVPELGARLHALLAKSWEVELLQPVDLTQDINNFPYGGGYVFSVDGSWPGLGMCEEYRVLEKSHTAISLAANLEDNTGQGRRIALRTGYRLRGELLEITHTVTNEGNAPVTLAPSTYPGWRYPLFGDAGRLELRVGDGAWRGIVINPEHRPNRNVVFAGDDLPAGAWRLASTMSPCQLEETFDAETLSATRLVFQTGDFLNLQLVFQARALAPGESADYWTSWRVLSI